MEELKEGWRLENLEENLEVILDYRGKTPQKSEKGRVTLSAKSVKMGYIDYSNIYYVSEETYSKFMTRGLPKKGDILLTTEAPLGCVAELKDDSVCLAQRLITLRGKKEKLNNKYLLYYLQSPRGQYELLSKATGTTVQGIKRTEFSKVKILMPSLEKQNKIASILSSLDEKIELNRKINQNLEETAQTLFKRWFIDFEFPNEEGKPYKSSGGKMIESELGEIPEGWKIKNLLEVGDFINGLAMQKYRPLDTEDSLKVIKIKEMNSGFSKESELCSVNIPDTYKVNFGDILFSWSGTLKVMFWNKECGGLNQHIFKVIPKNVNKLFLYFWLKIHLQTFIQIAQSKATTMGHIKRNDLNNSKIIVPNTEFWIYKEKILNSYLEKIVYQSKEIEKLIELRDYLLPKLMNGEIDVSNLKISKILNSD